MMGKLDNAVLELRPGAGQSKTIPVPITAIGFLASDGTGRDVSAADPMPTIAATNDPGVALLGKMYPTASVANTDDAAASGDWGEITLAANTIYADVAVAGACRLATPTTTPTGTKGCLYQPNIVYRIATPTGKLWAYGVGAAHAVYTTSFTRA